MIMLSCFAVVEPAAHASQLSQRLVLCCWRASGSYFAVVEPAALIPQLSQWESYSGSRFVVVS